MSIQRRTALLLLGILAMAMLLVYSNHFHNEFHFDDSHSIQENPYILSLRNIPKFFLDRTTSSNMPSHQGYRPLVTTTLAIDYALGRTLEPFYFHVSNFLWFLGVTLLIYPIAFHLLESTSLEAGRARFFSVIGAALYGVHTANAETVNYVIARSDILSALAHMLTFALYLRGGICKKYLLYLIPAALGLFAKESSLMVVPIFLAYLFLIENQGSFTELCRSSGISKVRRSLLSGLPLLLVCLSLFVLTMASGKYIPGGHSSRLYAMTQPWVLLLYGKTFLFPNHLSADTDLQLVRSFSDPRFLVGVCFLLGSTVVIVFSSRSPQWRMVSFGLLWFFFALLPSSSIVPLAEPMNDHRTFLAYVGLIFVLVAVLAVRAPATPQGNAFSCFVFVGVLLIHGFSTHQRNLVWKTEESLWRDVSLKSPKNGRGWMNYGLTQMMKGNFIEADIAYREAKKSVPTYPALHINIAVLKSAMGFPIDAEESFQLAMKLGHDQVEPFFFYARYLVEKNRYGEAELTLLRGLQIYQNHLGCRQLLLEVYKRLGKRDELRTLAMETRRLYPEDESAAEAIEFANHPEKSPFPTHEPTAAELVNQSLAYYNLGKYPEAIQAAERSLRINPRSPEAYNNICSSLISLKEYDRAIDACTQALAIRPSMEVAKNNLEWAKREKQGASQ